ncbi:unnamed protein product [Amoebophrya sp. A120]|nr:unnamed protein product [Amoebophrya sp. A120]|eukprot:GSA120T00022544001.1
MASTSTNAASSSAAVSGIHQKRHNYKLRVRIEVDEVSKFLEYGPDRDSFERDHDEIRASITSFLGRGTFFQYVQDPLRRECATVVLAQEAQRAVVLKKCSSASPTGLLGHRLALVRVSAAEDVLPDCGATAGTAAEDAGAFGGANKGFKRAAPPPPDVILGRNSALAGKVRRKTDAGHCDVQPQNCSEASRKVSEHDKLTLPVVSVRDEAAADPLRCTDRDCDNGIHQTSKTRAHGGELADGRAEVDDHGQHRSLIPVDAQLHAGRNPTNVLRHLLELDYTALKAQCREVHDISVSCDEPQEKLISKIVLSLCSQDCDRSAMVRFLAAKAATECRQLAAFCPRFCSAAVNSAERRDLDEQCRAARKRLEKMMTVREHLLHDGRTALMAQTRQDAVAGP